MLCNINIVVTFEIDPCMQRLGPEITTRIIYCVSQEII